MIVHQVAISTISFNEMNKKKVFLQTTELDMEYSHNVCLTVINFGAFGLNKRRNTQFKQTGYKNK